MWNFTEHVRQRMVERNIKEDDIRFVLFFGSRVHDGGKDFYFLEERNLSAKGRDFFGARTRRLVGTIVIVAGNQILTTLRNKKKLPKLQRFLYSH